MADIKSCEESVLLLFESYRQAKPTVHEAMKDAQELEKAILSTCSRVPVYIECNWVTAIANHPCFVPENALNAEVQVNSLLPYLSSRCCWVRSLACSLLRVFTAGLDHTGQHIDTQVTIICKNLQTTLEESLRVKDSRLNLCHVIACSSLCSIATSWAALLPLHSIKFVMLTVQTVMNILHKPDESSSAFLFQVALDGLGRIFKTSATWNILSQAERQHVITEYLNIMHQNSSTSDETTLARMLEVIDSSEILQTILNLPEKNLPGRLVMHLIDCLTPLASPCETPNLVVRWKSLSVIYNLLQLVECQDPQCIKPLLEKACLGSEQVGGLCNLIRKTFKEYLREVNHVNTK